MFLHPFSWLSSCWRNTAQQMNPDVSVVIYSKCLKLKQDQDLTVTHLSDLLWTMNNVTE